MDIGLGLISAQRFPGDDRSWSTLYAEALDLVVLAERLGFTTVWNTEHHFVDDGYMPSVLAFNAAAAARTERITLGTGVLLAPLYHPLRLAEDAATVDLISGERTILGLGLGWSPIEFEALGAEPSTRGRAMTEILGILGQAWSGRPVRHHGRVYDLPEVAVRPVPERPIPVWIGGHADPAVARAARLADGFFSNASPGRFAEQVGVAGQAMAEADRDPGEFRFAYYTMLYVTDDPDTTWDHIRPHVHYMRWKYGDMNPSAGREGALPAPPAPDAETERKLRAATWLGTAEELAARVHEVRKVAGVDFHFVARSYFPGLGYAEQAEALHRIAEELGPLI